MEHVEQIQSFPGFANIFFSVIEPSLLANWCLSSKLGSYLLEAERQESCSLHQ